MKHSLSRLLLALAAVIFLFGAAMHAIAFFSKAAHVVDVSDLKPFFGNEVKVLWLADSTTLTGLAILLGLMAIRPGCASRPVILLLSFIPAAITALLYVYLGPFYAAHLLLAATLMTIVAALMLPAHDMSISRTATA
ncbi:MAG TPA: hypothetical protein VKG63_11115 [Steroidobacteraceae bacterium]|nr:hypothetical protein [Steroidobacteraceae bacterium]